MTTLTIPLSLAMNSTYLEEQSILHDKVYPIGLGYKKYIESKKPDIKLYALVINTHNEVNIHFIENHNLEINKSQLIPNYSIESILDDIDRSDEVLISKLIDAQLTFILEKIKSYDKDFFLKGRIIYLENTTNYINYLNKSDQLILTDRSWKFREDEFINGQL